MSEGGNETKPGSPPPWGDYHDVVRIEPREIPQVILL